MLTVLIATYNGGKTLPKVLNAYRKIDPAGEEWRLVIVDNGSIDDTREVVNAFLPFLPITLLFEPRRGKNAALNTGPPQISGDLVVLTDDDVLPDANWLRELRLAADSQPLYSIFGGPILPEWEIVPDDSVLSSVSLKLTFGILDDQEEGPLENLLVFGGNMAIRSNIFEMGYKFDETIGPQGHNYAMGSESELITKLDRAGFKAWHCKNAVVRHIIRDFQVEKKWILERAVRSGRGQYRHKMRNPAWGPYLWGTPVRLLLKILKRICLLGMAKLKGKEKSVFMEHWYLNHFLGIASEARLMYKMERKSEK